MSDLGDHVAVLALIVSITSAVITLIRFHSDSKEQKRAARISSFTEIINQIGNEKARASRGIIRKSAVIQDFKKTPKPTPPKLDTNEEEAVRYVSSTYDRLGFIVKKDKEMEDEILGMHGDVIAEMWETLCPFIMEWRKTYRLYTVHFERLGKVAVEVELRANNQNVDRVCINCTENTY